ncbi:MAG: DNA methyltransferase [Deltaproteobacteria bacterium]|nr:DNA methyltransferase [Deltaproteobacteria bacterium]
MASPPNKPRPPRDNRPLLGPGGGRRSLSNVGGAVEIHGDPALGARLSHALGIRAGDHDTQLTHGFHAYPARMHPELARRVIASEPSAQSVLDPFCGSGTVVIEALCAGCSVTGTDLNPLALLLAKIKTRKSTNGERKALVSGAHAMANLAEESLKGELADASPRFEFEWFHPHTLRELVALRSAIATQPEGFVRDAHNMLLSSVLVKLSFQRSDSDPTRVRKLVPQGATFSLFSRKSFELAHALADLARSIPAETPPAKILEDDAQKLAHVPDHSVDLVLTSPPYAANYDYASHHARRYAWLGLDAERFRADEIGAARWFVDDPEAGAARFAGELDASVRAIARVLRPKGHAYLLIADGTAGILPLFAHDAVTQSASRAGLVVRARAAQVRPVFDARAARAFAETGRREHLILLTHESA